MTGRLWPRSIGGLCVIRSNGGKPLKKDRAAIFNILGDMLFARLGGIMGRDSDTAETYAAMTEARKKRHAEWRAENLRALRESGEAFEERATAVLFRSEEKSVDFYPDTGRWKIIRPRPFGDPFRGGGAERFLTWWKKKKK
jgi:hypothetical protein